MGCVHRSLKKIDYHDIYFILVNATGCFIRTAGNILKITTIIKDKNISEIMRKLAKRLIAALPFSDLLGCTFGIQLRYS